MQYFGAPDQLEEAVECLVHERMKIFHSMTPANVIKKYMGLESYLSFTGFPDTYMHRDCDSDALIEFFRQTIKS